MGRIIMGILVGILLLVASVSFGQGMGQGQPGQGGACPNCQIMSSPPPDYNGGPGPYQNPRGMGKRPYQNGMGPNDRGMQGMRDYMDDSMECLRKNNKKLANRLEKMKTKAKRNYDRIMMHHGRVFCAMGKSKDVSKYVSEQVEMEMDLNEMIGKYRKHPDEKLKKDIANKAGDIFDSRMKMEEERIKMAEERLKEVRERIKERKAKKQEVVDKQMERILKGTEDIPED
jgi:hypothetical protein